MSKTSDVHMKTISTSLCTTKYSMYDFITAVRDNPVIWDRRNVNFRHRLQREQAWKCVARKLCSSFNKLNAAEQQRIVKVLQKRWKNTRDGFFRARRFQQLSDERTRTYTYGKELMFLLEYRTGNAPQQNLSKGAEVSYQEEEESLTKSPIQGKRTADAATNAILAKRSKPKNSPTFELVENQQQNNLSSTETAQSSSPQQQDTHLLMKSIKNCKVLIATRTPPLNSSIKSLKEEIKNEIVERNPDEAVDNTKQQKSPQKAKELQQLPQQAAINKQKEENDISDNEATLNGIDGDQAFFESIKPDLRRLNESQKLDFKIEVLNLLKVALNK